MPVDILSITVFLFSFHLSFVYSDACILGVVKLLQRLVFHIILLASLFYLAFMGFRLYVGGSLCHLPWNFPLLCILPDHMYLYVPKIWH